MQLDPNARLAYGEVVLRPMVASDADALLAIARPIAEDFIYSLLGPAEREYVPSALRARAAGTQIPFVVEHAGRIVGSTRFADISHVDRHLEIGWTWYVRDARGTSVNPTAKYLLLKHAFEDLGMIRVALKCDGRNIASQRGIEKLGATREGVLRKHMLTKDGFLRDTVYYSILADEWSRTRTLLAARITL